ncbi:MAG: hypothetical protein GTO46_10370 [Gemmatimonadetes bacterium]|nr:hypothetical protein [Gemmatimonadota bacterium]NIO32017.1 hypothetical protein [Gemmatimonadota bacterium]
MTKGRSSPFALGVLLVLAMLPGTAHGQEEDLAKRVEELERQVEQLREELAVQDSAVLAVLRRQIEALTREIEELRLGEEVVVAADTSVYGFGPAASKVYHIGQGVSIGGYGEALYENFSGRVEDGSPSGKTDQLDFLRAVFYFGYKFNDRLLFNSEIELEHASTSQSGSVSVEFAYLDYRASDLLGVRGGLVLVPMGFINELHEPPTFLGTERPETERRVVPTTWRENGLGVFGEAAGFVYRGYLVNGLDAVGGGSSKAGGFSAAGLRGGRQKGSKAVAENLAVVARVDFTGLLGFLAGTSLYVGRSGQGADSPLDGSVISAPTVIWEGHAEYRAQGLDLRALLALASVDDVADINAAKGLTGAESVGERLVGWYVQAGYNVLRSARTSQQLVPYARYESINTQDRVPDGFAADPANDEQVVTLGAAWKPIVNIAIKADYQFRRNGAGTGVDQFNVALGYLF